MGAAVFEVEEAFKRKPLSRTMHTNVVINIADTSHGQDDRLCDLLQIVSRDTTLQRDAAIFAIGIQRAQVAIPASLKRFMHQAKDFHIGDFAITITGGSR